MSIQIEPANLSDLDEIVAIERESFTTPWSREAFEVELNGNTFSRVLVARRVAQPETRLVGYCCFWTVFEELRLLTFAVHPETRRQGIGAQLLTHALAEGGTQGATRVLLEVRASNVGAQMFYRRFGFRPYGRRANYYTNPVEDAILMTLDPLPSEKEASGDPLAR